MDNSSQLVELDLSVSCDLSDNFTIPNSTIPCRKTIPSLYTLRQLRDVKIFIQFFEWFQSAEYFVCFIANILTIRAVIKYESLHCKASNILILGLACSDGILGKIKCFSP